MVIHDLHLMSIAIAPNEANAILVVDSNAVLASPVAAQGFESVAREGPQVFQPMCGMKLPQFPLRHPGDAPESPRGLAEKEGLRVPIPKRPDHALGSVLREA